MKIAIISDTHDNIANIRKVLNYLAKNKIKKLIHCGDFTSRETLEYILKNFKGKIFVVLGNAEVFQVKILKPARNAPNEVMTGGLKTKSNSVKLKNLKDMGIVKVDNIKIGITHRPQNINKLIKEKPDYIFYGHTHRPWVKAKQYNGKNIILANPGNLAGIYYKPTFAILNTKDKKLELKILDLI